MGLQLELQTPDPIGSTPLFLQTVGQVKTFGFFCTSLHHQDGRPWKIEAGSYLSLWSTVVLALSPASCLAFILDCCPSWSTVTLCSHQTQNWQLSITPTIAHGIFPIIGPFLCRLALFFFPDWTLNYWEIYTRKGSKRLLMKSSSKWFWVTLNWSFELIILQDINDCGWW